jgi:hypothetical protein
MRFLIYASLFFFSSFLLNAQATKCSIQLLAQDKETDKPIAEANVWCNDKLMGVTDATGAYVYSEAILGEAYTFTVKPIGYEAKTEKRWAKEQTNKCISPMEFRTLTAMITNYQNELRRDSPDKLKLDAWYAIIIDGLDMESNRIDKDAFLTTNASILKEKEDKYKYNMTSRDQELKPIIRDNYDKLTEFRR